MSINKLIGPSCEALKAYAQKSIPASSTKLETSACIDKAAKKLAAELDGLAAQGKLQASLDLNQFPSAKFEPCGLTPPEAGLIEKVKIQKEINAADFLKRITEK